jgi:hypothetical protein
MTTLVFNSGILTIATESWMVTERRDADSRIQVYAPKGDCARLDITMDEFLALISDGGKVVDLRKLQEKS